MTTSDCRAGIVLLVSLLAIAPTALADAPCDKGMRDVAPGERTRISTFLQVAKDALPPAPEGWQIRGDEEFSIPTSICRDIETVPWTYGFTRSYVPSGDHGAGGKEMSISVRINDGGRRPGKNATNLTLPTGAVTAVRWQDDDPAVTVDYALYLFGSWKRDSDGTWRLVPRANVLAALPHAVSVYVIAERDRLANLVQGIDFGKIAAISR